MNLKKRFKEKKNIYYLLLIVLIFTADRFTKEKIINHYNESNYHLNDFINFDLIWNSGIGFGLLSLDSPIAYNVVTLFIAIIIISLVYIAIISDALDRFNFSIIIGGALGNFYDRVFYLAVPDFIDLHYKTLHWFTFNVADIFITLGIIAFLMSGFFIKINK